MCPIPKLDLPLTFRRELAQQVLDLVAAGESCALVGIGSVGKSNLLRFLARDDVREHYLGSDAQEFLPIYVDANKALRRSSWGLWELFLHQLVVALTERGIDEKISGQIDDLHKRATQRETRFLALRYLDRALALLCGQLGYRPVFFLDELDSLAPDLNASAYAGLRALRDDHKYRVMYVLATRRPLEFFSADPADTEALGDLIAMNTLWMGPYNREDAEFMLHRLQARYGTSLSSDRAKEVVRISGGHPGLLRAVFRVANDASMNESPDYLVNRGVHSECAAIWRSLTAQERRTLDRIASGLAVGSQSREAMRNLTLKGLIGGAWAARGNVFSSLFLDYVRQIKPFAGNRVQVDPGRQIVTVDGCEIADLTGLEFKLVQCLAERRGDVVSRDDLAAHLYPDDMRDGGNISDQAIDAVVKRARATIEPVPGEHQLIVTVRGRGFKLDDGQADDAE